MKSSIYPIQEHPQSYSKWFLPALWQVFLGFFFIKFFISPLPFPGMVLCLITLPIYLFAYFWGFYQTDNKRFFAAVIMIICGIITAPYNYGASVFLQFGALYLGNSTKPAYALVGLALLIGIILSLSYRFQLPFSNFTLPALLVSISLCAFGIFDRQRRISESRLEKTEAQLQSMAAIAERERIGRDLHDVLGHTLTVITLKSSVVRKLLQNKDYLAAEKEIIQVEETARKTSKMLQKVVSDYGDISIQDELNNLTLLLEQLGISVNSLIELPDQLNEPIAKALSLIIRESVTNLIKHANASECQIQLYQQNDHLYYIISDNGISNIHSNPTRNNKANNKNARFNFGNGLTGINQRVEQLKGIFEIHHQQGTRLQVSIPVKTHE